MIAIKLIVGFLILIGGAEILVIGLFDFGRARIISTRCSLAG
jgi:hypothetical protein